MMKLLSSVIENNIILDDDKIFAAILGSTPSYGARSPKLWNMAFKAHGVDATMHPLDIRPSRIYRVLEILEAESNFVGGAVAMPYKEMVANWLGKRLTPEAARIGAVNCLFRNNQRLWGTNTDGESALTCLEHFVGSLKDKRVLLIGVGGAGRAVSAFLAGRAKTLTLAGRCYQSAADYTRRLGVRCSPWDRLNEECSQADILVNCTSVGSAAGGTAGESPITSDQVCKLPSDASVFDIIYDPPVTALLKLARASGLRTMNGDSMNLEQAVIAFNRTLPQLGDPEITRQAMAT